ncbi:DHA2 family efflux MFS transporter permease subunit [Variovorax sp. YR566]|uniref:DHA2 family efflux MFS transporter permease subunit n=1 Tax=Variovorax sp. YR566 TaxID=3450237 RepID=UPI003F7EF94E
MKQTETLRSLPMTGASKVVATASIMLATILTGLDSTIVNVALPQMQRGFEVSQDAAMLVVTSYIVAAAIATPMIGWVSSHIGRTRLYLIAIAGFTVSSVWCGWSGSLTEIVCARVVQGCFGAVLVPVSQALILDINPPGKQAQALAQWGAGVMLGPILGPVIGGLLTEYHGWPWIFYINIPVGLVAFAGIATRALRTAPEPARSFDLTGFLSMSITVGLLQLILDTGQHVGWLDSTALVCALVVMMLAFAVFIRHTLRGGPGGFFNKALLMDRNYVTGLFFTAVVGALLFSTRALLPQLLVNVAGYSVADAGVLMAPTGVGTLAAMLFAGKIIARVDPRLMMAGGFLVTGGAILQLVLLRMPVQATSIVTSGLVLGAGLGLIFAPLNAITFATLAAGMRSDGAAFFALSRNFGSSAGVSLMQSLLTHRTGVNLANHGATEAAFFAYLFDFRLLLILNLGVIPFLLFMKYRRSNASMRGKE